MLRVFCSYVVQHSRLDASQKSETSSENAWHTMFDQLGFLVQDQEWREEEEWGVTETLPETGKIPGDSFFSASNI